ncbi:MAG: SapC family protein [Pelagimonas sp.]|nr:SapC family protein [Pelagimonas sp.]
MIEFEVGSLALSDDIQSRFIPVTSQAHGQLCWQRFTSYAYARRYRTAPVVLPEIHQVANVAPVLFSQSESTPAQAVMVLHLDQTYSLISEDGQWRGTYVPGSLRIHPFGIGSSNDERADALCLDPQSPCLGNLGAGTRLFDPAGGVTKEFETVIDFAQTYRRFHLRTQQACGMLRKAELLIPASRLAAFDRPGCEDLYVIDREALGQITPKWQSMLFQTGALELAYAHMTSLGRLAALRHMQSDAPQPAAAAPVEDNGFLQAMSEAYGADGADIYLNQGSE